MSLTNTAQMLVDVWIEFDSPLLLQQYKSFDGTVKIEYSAINYTHLQATRKVPQDANLGQTKQCRVLEVTVLAMGIAECNNSYFH